MTPPTPRFLCPTSADALPIASAFVAVRAQANDPAQLRVGPWTRTNRPRDSLTTAVTMRTAPPVPEQLKLPLPKPTPKQRELYRPRDAADLYVGDKRPRNTRYRNDGRPKKPAFGITPCEERD